MIFARLCMCALLCLSFAAAASGKATPEAGSCKGYIVIDAATGGTLLEQDADEICPPASMTKLMTFLVVHDAIKAGTLTLQTPVDIAPEDAGIGGSQVYLDAREVFTVEELLYAIMIQSANDASSALAHATAGTREEFVARMNAKAQALGMSRTVFVTPHGLSATGKKARQNPSHKAPSDLTTPRDFAKLCQVLLQTTDVLTYCSVKDRPFGAGVRKPSRVIAMHNHNSLLNPDTGVDGLKTGYTEGAGYCLSATAKRNERRIICVIMGAFGPNGQIDKGLFRNRKTAELLRLGFAALPAAPASPISAASDAPLISTSEGSKPTEDTPAVKFMPAPKRARKN